MTKRNVYIDGDWIVYAAGFAGQKTDYAYMASTAGPFTAENITAVKAELEQRGADFEPDAVYSRVVVDPPEHVYHSAKNMLLSTRDRISEKLNKPADAFNFQIYIDGDGNFRHKIATIRPYKGTRIAPRPVMYHELRAYLRDVWGALEVFAEETDDKLSILAHQPQKLTPVLVGVDKDFLQIPAIHYNPNKGFTKINAKQGELLLYRQCLTGDATDNIAGCYKVGPKKAASIISTDMPEQDKWDATVAAYARSITQYGEQIYGGLTATEAALENMRLVRLRNFEGEIWMPPGQRDD